MATVYQRCKSDKRNANYPCTESRCRHPWTVRYREPFGARAERQPSFEKKTQADVFAAQLDRDKYEGFYLDPKRGDITLRDYATDWLERQVVAEGTWRNYDSFLRIHLLPALGAKTITAVETRDIEAFVVAVSKKLAASTVRDRMKMVSSLFKTAVKEKRRADNPTDGVRLPRIGAHAVDEDEIPTLHEVDLIAKQISPQYRLTVYLQAGAGLRISETLAFSADCRRDGFVRIRRQVSAKAHRDDCVTRFIPLKHRAEGEYRDIPTPAFLDAEIDNHLNTWGTTTVKGVEVLFAPRERGKGTMPTANTYGYHFRKALMDAGLVKPDGKPKYTPHGLRHFFASTALAHGIPIHEVSRWLGHKSIKTTVDVYGHLVPASWDRCRTIMQKALRPGDDA
ncbi:tyrosine-type recombinase/integrase [Streptomyces sp. 3214.6]|uniref:tyrosine-type recombinase/integrase n=1 Tax=Streptomyces sp. 3214.6 TaxID=1882757 RepID=UPI000909B343|nr:site-specific integrase [Streptomyces sp. 3214.6]SHI00512.1 Site-specific recombinase XerD [Streptomyces sp. 3214.6]